MQQIGKNFNIIFFLYECILKHFFYVEHIVLSRKSTTKLKTLLSYL